MTAQTLNDAADGFKAIIEAIETNLVRFYPEPEEKPAGQVSGEVYFQNMVMRNAAAKLYDVDAIIELSTPANLPGWSGAVRRIRDLTSPFGSRSVYSAVIAAPTLGGRVTSALPLDTYLRQETRKKFPDGDRWCQEVAFRVRLAG